MNTNYLVSISEATQDFERFLHLVQEHGSIILHKNHVPCYVIAEYRQSEKVQIVPDEEVFALSRSLIEKNREVYEVFAK